MKPRSQPAHDNKIYNVNSIYLQHNNTLYLLIQGTVRSDHKP